MFDMSKCGIEITAVYLLSVTRTDALECSRYLEKDLAAQLYCVALRSDWI